MTQEEKELLLKDLCARLPYEAKVHIEHDVFYDEIEPYDSILSPKILDDFLRMERLEVKPYLRPMSSMTEEEHRELSRLVNDDNLLTGEPATTVCLHCGVVIDFHNSHHLDWRGLIEKGLALEAPEDMY